VDGSERHTAGSKLVYLAGCLALIAAACGGSAETGTAPSAPATGDGSSTSTGPSTIDAPTSTTSAAARTTTTAALPVRGVDWEISDVDFRVIDAVVVDDRLWVSGLDGAETTLVLAFTDDGRAWERVDLAGAGMTVLVGPRGVEEIQGESALAEVDGELFGLFAPSPVEGVSADGVKADMWLVTTLGADNNDVVVVGPTASGIDQRIGEPDRIDPDALKYTNFSDFRVSEIGGIAGRDGRLHIAIDGQRWAPRATTDSDFTAFTLSGTQLESVYNENKFGGGFIEFAGIAPLGDTFVAVGRRGDRPRVLFSYVTTDGVDWIEAEAEPPAGEWADVVVLAASPMRLVAAGLEGPEFGGPSGEEFPVTWWSDDGAEWNRVELPVVASDGPAAPILPVGAVWAGSEFLVLGSGGRAVDTIWASPDGIEWSFFDSDNLPELRVQRVLMWRDRVVVVGQRSVAFTPPLP
jgi:hypothetical protein